MTKAMKSRKRLAVIIFFALATLLLAPIAWYLGFMRGARVSDYGANVSESLGDLVENDCADLGPPGGFSHGYMELDCKPTGQGGGWRIARGKGADRFAANDATSDENPVTPHAITRRSNLSDAVADKISQAGSSEGASANQSGEPVSLAMAPTSGDGDGSGGPGYPFNDGNFGGPGGGGFGGLPDTNIPELFGPGADQPGLILDMPDITFAPVDPFTPSTPAIETPELVTPIPSGVFLMLTGLLGFFAAFRFRQE